ncbi:MAG: ArnT family glycosyltransferase [Weeksellaceae bacterium]
MSSKKSLHQYRFSLRSFIQEHILLIILLVIFSFIYFYHLDYQTIGSWDEGWYASISREMVKSGEYVFMNWNGKPFYDHPPMGMWLVAGSYHLLGISEFSTRFPSAILGVLTVAVMYFMMKEISKQKTVAFVAPLILGTAVWYVIRVRSGNLDSPFVFFYALTMFSALKAPVNPKFLLAAGISVGCLMMTKTLVGLSAIPLIFFITLPQYHLRKLRTTIPWLLSGVVAAVLIVVPWYYIHLQTYSDFVQQHFVNIGTRNKTFMSYFQLQAELPLFYLHMGIRKWYYLWILAISYLTIRKAWNSLTAALLVLWNLVILYPFLTTTDTHIWHLIPVYIPVALVTSYGLYLLATDAALIASRILKPVSQPLSKLAQNQTLIKSVYVAAFVYIAFIQFRIFQTEVFPMTRSTPDDVDISRKAGVFTDELYLDDDYLPLAVFYSGRFMKQLAYEPEGKKTLVELYRSDEQNFKVITRISSLNNLRVEKIPYRIYGLNNSFAIVGRK